MIWIILTYALCGLITGILIVSWSANLTGKITLKDIIVGGAMSAIIWPIALFMWIFMILERGEPIVLWKRKS